MATSAGTAKVPVHGLAWLGFGASLFAVVLAFYGSLYAEKHLSGSPLREARGAAGLPATPRSWHERVLANIETSLFGDRIDRKMVDITKNSNIANYTIQLIAFVIPFVMGITAALLGGWAMTIVERENGRYSGNFQGVFSILIGMFAAVISGCMMFSLYVWPNLPSLYHT